LSSNQTFLRHQLFYSSARIWRDAADVNTISLSANFGHGAPICDTILLRQEDTD